jgi:hypothetical protein
MGTAKHPEPQCPDLDLCRPHPEYKSQALLLEPTSAVSVCLTGCFTILYQPISNITSKESRKDVNDEMDGNI